MRTIATDASVLYSSDAENRLLPRYERVREHHSDRHTTAYQQKESNMTQIATETVEIFGTGVLEAEGVVVDREGNAWGGGRNGTVYKVSPDGVVHKAAQLPEGAVPNGVTLDRAGN